MTEAYTNYLTVCPQNSWCMTEVCIDHAYLNYLLLWNVVVWVKTSCSLVCGGQFCGRNLLSSNRLHGVVTQTTAVYTFTAVKTSNPTFCLFFEQNRNNNENVVQIRCFHHPVLTKFTHQSFLINILRAVHI